MGNTQNITKYTRSVHICSSCRADVAEYTTVGWATTPSQLSDFVRLRSELKQERPAIADKPARRLRNVCTVYVRAVVVSCIANLPIDSLPMVSY